MKYMLLFIDATPEEDIPAVYAEIANWWGEQAAAGVVLEGYQLQPPQTATTVNKQHGKAVVTDGPYIEAKESIGGYGIIEVPDLDAAISVAKSWPGPNSKVEIRPLIVY